MADLQRRTFLQSTVSTAATLATVSQVQAAPAQKIRIGVIGPGGMGMNHIKSLALQKEVEVAYVCDPDSVRLANAAKAVEDLLKTTPKAVKDLREVLDDHTVQAVIIATPDHWHTPASILAMEAGKHVYVEKPCSHNIREGRLLVETAQRTGKLLQVGMQSRSAPFLQEAIKRLHDGEIGEIISAKAWNSQLRRNIGKTKPSEPPKTLDFALWQGPAPETPYRANLLPGIWRWWYDFGCGDMGNDGVHDIDVTLWGMNVNTHPNRVTCLGGKYFFDDDQQFPDTQYAIFEYAVEGKPHVHRQFIYEQRIWSPYVQEGYENGSAFYGTKGMMILGHSNGWKMYGPKNKLIAEKEGSPTVSAHHTNFFECIRGNQKQLNAPAIAGHLSATIVHLANISARVSEVLEFNPKTEEITNDEAANAMVKRKYRAGHWAVPKNL